ELRRAARAPHPARPAARRGGARPSAPRRAWSTSTRGTGCTRSASSTTASSTAASAAGVRSNALPTADAQVVAVGRAVLRLGDDHVVVGGIDRGIETVAAADAEPVRVHDPAASAHSAWSAPAAVVLQPDVDVIRPAHVGGADVRETGRHPVDVVPHSALAV